MCIYHRHTWQETEAWKEGNDKGAHRLQWISKISLKWLINEGLFAERFADCLQIFDVLNKFRWHSVALTADIEKGSLMIGISEHDQEMLRFLWFENPHEMDSKLIHLRFKRLPLGLCPSPSILRAIIAHHLNLHRKKFPDLVEAIENSMNVDDLLTGEKKRWMRIWPAQKWIKVASIWENGIQILPIYWRRLKLQKADLNLVASRKQLQPF